MVNESRLDIPAYLAHYRERVEQVLDEWLPGNEIQPPRLHEAMRYATTGGGKRIRANLVYAAGQVADAPDSALDGPAAAVELIHAYSLVHDDLPAMDDDDLRRGKPTCHKAYDEATAILVGDGLQALAFYALAHDHNGVRDPLQRLKMVEALALASGSRGMVGGQAIDIDAEGKTLNLTELENMHIHKTGALIRASVNLGALTGGADVKPEVHSHLDRYAKCMGLAFQIHDDVLDLESDTETLGKRQGADEARGKSTYPSLVGLSRAKEMEGQMFERALESLETMGPRADPLRGIAEFIVQRSH